MGKDEPPLSMMTLSEKATIVEKPAIAKWREILLDHKKKFVAHAEQYYGSMVASRGEVLYANRIALIVELYSQNISYGEYNRKTKALYVKHLEEEAGMERQQSRIQQMRPPTPTTSDTNPCQQNTVMMPGGKMLMCTKCCYSGQCQTS